MHPAEGRHRVKDGVVRLLMHGVADVGHGFDLLDQRPMLGGHVITHIVEVIRENGSLVGNLHEGDQRRHDAALRAGLAAKVMQGAAVDAFIDHVLEEADVRPKRLVVQLGIHVLGNALEHLHLTV